MLTALHTVCERHRHVIQDSDIIARCRPSGTKAHQRTRNGGLKSAATRGGPYRGRVPDMLQLRPKWEWIWDKYVPRFSGAHPDPPTLGC